MEGIEEILKRIKRAETFTNTKTPTSPTSTSQASKRVYNCPDCKDTKFIFTGPNDGYPCPCIKKDQRAKLFRRSGISDDFQGLNFDNFDMNRPEQIQNMARAAYKYRQNFQEIRSSRKNSILLMGRPGSGKTHLLAAVANGLIEDLVDVVYFPYAEGFDMLRGDLDGSHKKIQPLKDCSVLFLDDLFKTRRGELPTKYQLDTIYSIVNARYMAHRPMLISTELSAAELLAIDEATASRIIEMAGDYKIHITGKPEDMNFRLR